MFKAVIEEFDKEFGGIVVGATIDDYEYRKPILNFWREGDARLFCNYLNRYPRSRYIDAQLAMLAKNYQANRHKLVTDFDFKLKDGEIRYMTIKRRRYEES